MGFSIQVATLFDYALPGFLRFRRGISKDMPFDFIFLAVSFKWDLEVSVWVAFDSAFLLPLNGLEVSVDNFHFSLLSPSFGM